LKLDGSEIEMEILISDKILDYLTYIGYIGQLYPVSTKSRAKTIIGVLSKTIDPILDQLAFRFKLEMSKSELLTFLKRNNISVFSDIDDFVKAKQKAELHTEDMAFLEGVRERYNSLVPLVA
jgi:hypothetical protein